MVHFRPQLDREHLLEQRHIGHVYKVIFSCSTVTFLPMLLLLPVSEGGDPTNSSFEDK